MLKFGQEKEVVDQSEKEIIHIFKKLLKFTVNFFREQKLSS